MKINKTTFGLCSAIKCYRGQTRFSIYNFEFMEMV